MIDVSDQGRVRIVRFNRPEAKNAMNEVMWQGASDALAAAAVDPAVAVVVITGTGDAFSAGQDLLEMAEIATGGGGGGGFVRLGDELARFPKPLICAVNGIGLGFGATILGFADLAFMATTARLKCPFTRLGVAPELASSHTFPELIGRQNATWALMSSEWLDAATCLDMGLVFQLAEPHELMDVTMQHAQVLASKPIPSLIECKRVITEATADLVTAARRREDDAFKVLLGTPANIESMRAFAEKREPDFSEIDGA